jgi:hypothetical protein
LDTGLVFAIYPVIFFSIYPIPGPDQHFPIFIDRYPLSVDQFGFEVSKIVIVKLELALESTVRNSPLTLQPGFHLHD